MIILDHVYLFFQNGVKALQDINVHIAKEEFVFLVGPTGSGKSSLLKLLYREAVPTHGRVLVDKIDVGTIKQSQIPFLRRNIGVVFQDYKLLPKKTVFENISFALEVAGENHRRINKIVPQVLEIVGLHRMKDSYPFQLSGGEQQRVSIARALAKNPKLLLCDEPTGALDYNTGRSILKLLSSTVKKYGMTVVVITHNSALAPIADKIITVKNGQIESVTKNTKPVPIERIEW